MNAVKRAYLTVRGIPRDLALALESEKRRRGKSLNQTVIELLNDALGVTSGRVPTNGLEKLAGSWTEDDLKEFEASTAVFEQIDPELWR